MFSAGNFFALNAWLIKTVIKRGCSSWQRNGPHQNLTQKPRFLKRRLDKVDKVRNARWRVCRSSRNDTKNSDVFWVYVPLSVPTASSSSSSKQQQAHGTDCHFARLVVRLDAWLYCRPTSLVVHLYSIILLDNGCKKLVFERCARGAARGPWWRRRLGYKWWHRQTIVVDTAAISALRPAISRDRRLYYCIVQQQRQ